MMLRRVVKLPDPPTLRVQVDGGAGRAAGAILDDAGNMIGSAVFAEFPTREHLDAWLAREPYVRQKV